MFPVKVIVLPIKLKARVKSFCGTIPLPPSTKETKASNIQHRERTIIKINKDSPSALFIFILTILLNAHINKTSSAIPSAIMISTILIELESMESPPLK
jgi:hypothetical protein